MPFSLNINYRFGPAGHPASRGVYVNFWKRRAVRGPDKWLGWPLDPLLTKANPKT